MFCKKIFLFLAMFSSCVSVIASSGLEQRIVNVVVLNDVTEKPIEMFPVTNYLALALSDQELVLCTEHIWQVLVMAAQNFEKSFAYSKYQKVKEGFDAFLKKYGSIDKAPVNDAYKFFQLMQDNLSDNHNILCYSVYQMMKELGYSCKQLDNGYLLFIPKKLSQYDFSKEDLSLIKEANLQAEDVIIGFKASMYKDYDYMGPLEINTSSDPENLVKVLKDISIKTAYWKTDLYDQISLLLPVMDIVLIGHGTYDRFDKKMAEMNVDTMGNFLKALGTNYNTKSLTIISCFGGAVISHVVQSFKSSVIFENLKYTILLGAGAFSGIFMLPEKKAASMVTRSDKGSIVSWIDKSVYTINGKYFFGPAKNYDGKVFFGKFFEYMNGQAYKDLPQYTKAAEILAYTNDASDPNMQNTFMIRYPNTKTWTAVTDARMNTANTNPGYEVKTKEIGFVEGNKESGVIKISKNITQLILKTRYIKAPIVVDNSVNFYMIPGLVNQNHPERLSWFYIEKMTFTNSGYQLQHFFKSLAEKNFLSSTFQPYAFLIKELDFAGTVIHNFLFYFDIHMLGRPWDKQNEIRSGICLYESLSYPNYDTYMPKKGIIFYSDDRHVLGKDEIEYTLKNDIKNDLYEKAQSVMARIQRELVDYKESMSKEKGYQGSEEENIKSGSNVLDMTEKDPIKLKAQEAASKWSDKNYYGNMQTSQTNSKIGKVTA